MINHKDIVPKCNSNVYFKIRPAKNEIQRISHETRKNIQENQQVVSEQNLHEVTSRSFSLSELCQ